MTTQEVDEIPLHDVPAGETRRFWLRLTRDEIGEWHRVPVIVRRGLEDGPVVGLTAAIHGNELNGMSVLHQLLEAPEATTLRRGALVAVPVVNLPGYRRHQRAFADGKDLNRFIKENEPPRPAQRFGYRFAKALVPCCDFLFDLHTAGGGRRNAFYARVDLGNKAATRLAKLLRPPIIAHKPPRNSALRGYAVSRGVPAVVLEIGDAGRLQPSLIEQATGSLLRVLADLGMVAGAPEATHVPVVCGDSYWIRASQGGATMLNVELASMVEEGQRIGRTMDIWGDVREDIVVPRAGVVIGLQRRPMVMEGTPIVHIGVLVKEQS